MLNPVPWLMGNGAEHSPSVARILAYAATSGANGISTASDMRVTDLSTPGTSIVVGPGAAVIRNAYPGGAGQSYIAHNESNTTVPVPATDSTGGATRYVVIRVEDPAYGGQAPADPVNGPYVSFELVNDSVVGLAYPHVVLAKIVQPASTATITQSMITDLRKVAVGRTHEVVHPRPNIYSDTGLTLSSRSAYPDGEWFPNAGGDLNNGVYQIDIPEWATRMQIRFEWNGVRMNQRAGWGLVWVAYGPSSGTANPLHYTQGFNWDANESNTYRTNFVAHQEVAVLPEWRGTTQPFIARGNILSPSGAPYTGDIRMDSGSGTVFSIRFMEVAD